MRKPSPKRGEHHKRFDAIAYAPACAHANALAGASATAIADASAIALANAAANAGASACASAHANGFTSSRDRARPGVQGGRMSKLIKALFEEAAPNE